MPVHCGSTTRKGKRVGYCQWGRSGKKYYYRLGDKRARQRAKARAERQGRAARAHGYKG